MTTSAIRFLTLVLFSVIVYGQESVQVKEALDSHQFRLEDGRVVQLANVDAPSFSDTSRISEIVTESIKEYQRKEIIGCPHYLVPTGSQIEDSVLMVHLIRKYPLNRVNINLEYLKCGWGYYLSEPQSEYSESYFIATQKAYQKKTGVWNRRYLLRRTPSALVKRFRGMGGVGTWLDGYEREYLYVPLLGFSYRISKLLNLAGNSYNYLSLYAEYANYFVFLNYIHFGPEIRIRRYFSISGGIGAIIIPVNSRWDDSAPFFPTSQVILGILFPNRSIELEIGILYSYVNEPMIRCAFCFSNPFI